MPNPGRLCGLLLMISGIPVVGEAAGTPAGTVIQSTATVSYTLGSAVIQDVISQPANITVVQLIRMSLTSQDAMPVAVTSPDTNRALTFQVTNTGNGTETLSLARNNAIAGDAYDPVDGSAGAIFLESGLQPGFQAAGPIGDIAYTPGSNDPTLAADTSRIVYAVSNTPASLADGSRGDLALAVASTIPGAAGAPPGTTLAGQGIGGVDAVVGSGGAQASQVASYLVGNVGVAILKTVSAVVDQQGGSSVTTGAMVTYHIVVNATGTGTAQGLSVADPIPYDTTYVADSITVDGAARSDAADGDNADFSAGAVHVQFGDTATPARHIIKFRVLVN